VAIKIFTVNLPSGAPNVTERASQKDNKFPDRF